MKNSNLASKCSSYGLYFTNSNKILNLLISFFLVFILISCAKTTNLELKRQLLPHTRSEWKKLIEWPVECDDGIRHITVNSPAFVGVESYRMSSGIELVIVVCKTGAYNQGEMVFIKISDEKSNYKVLTFPQFASVNESPSKLKWSTCAETTLSGDHCLKKGGADNNTEPALYKFIGSLLWGNLRIETKNNRIIVDNFYRGGGGCGISTSYSISEEVPSIFELKVYEQCGQTNLPVGSWPTVPFNQYQSWPIGEAVIR